jgi:hypothetical protein
MAGIVTSCPKCGQSFTCKSTDIQNCACTAIYLDAALQTVIKNKYKGCLCIACLQALQQDAATKEVIKGRPA